MNTRSLTNPHKKKSRGVRSGERGGHAIGAALPIHQPGKRVLRYSHTSPWGFVKDRVFVTALPENFVELRTRITAAVAKVTPEMLRSVWQETDYRWDVCRITNGSHIEP